MAWVYSEHNKVRRRWVGTGVKVLEVEASGRIDNTRSFASLSP